MSYLAILALVSLAVSTGGEQAPAPPAGESSVRMAGATDQGTWDELVYEAIELRRRGAFLEAAEAFFRAAKINGADNAQQYWDACVQYSRAGRPDAAFAALDLSIGAGIVDVDRLLSHPRLDAMRADSRWLDAVSRMRTAEAAYVARLKSPAFRIELLAMWKRDQQLVGDRERQAEVIRDNTRRLAGIIEEIGWPADALVGRDGAWAAWAIAQHAADIQFQRRSLELMAQVLATRGMDPAQYAELHDRIRRNTKLPQTFGMATMEREGRLGLYPIHDEHDVDVRRKAIGLPPLRVFAHLSSIRYVRPSADAARAEAARRRVRARDRYADALTLLGGGNFETARQRFEEALEIYGALTDDEIYEFAARHAAALPGMRSADAGPIYGWLQLLVDRQWMGRSRLLFDRRFDPIRRGDEWRQLAEGAQSAVIP
jgi:tetratricopeptide (TPR) repeat protein